MHVATEECDQHRLLTMTLRSTFCMRPRSDALTRSVLFDALMPGCDPAVFRNEYHLTFDHFIPWQQKTVYVHSAKRSPSKLAPVSLLSFADLRKTPSARPSCIARSPIARSCDSSTALIASSS